MRTQLRHSRGGWTIEEDDALLNLVNKHCHSSGRMSWARVRLLPGRTLMAMQSRWKVLHSSCLFDKNKWSWKEASVHKNNSNPTRKTIRQEVEEFLKTYPDADNTTVANFVNCDASYVSRIRTENKIHKVTPIANVVKAKKTPQNAPAGVLPKRVVVKKSFLWGAFKFERYE